MRELVQQTLSSGNAQLNHFYFDNKLQITGGMCIELFPTGSLLLDTTALWKDSTLKWSEQQAVTVDWEDLELHNKDCVTLIQFAEWLMWLNRFFRSKFTYGPWLHSHGMGMTSHDCLERKHVVKVTAHARKVQLLLRSESANCLAKCLRRMNVIVTYIKQRCNRVRQEKEMRWSNCRGQCWDEFIAECNEW